MPDTPIGPKRSRALPATAIVLAATALFLLASLLLAVTRGESPGLVREVLAAPGRFLLDSFWWAAFFVPVYFLVGMTLLFLRGFRRRWPCCSCSRFSPS